MADSGSFFPITGRLSWGYSHRCHGVSISLGFYLNPQITLIHSVFSRTPTNLIPPFLNPIHPESTHKIYSISPSHRDPCVPPFGLRCYLAYWAYTMFVFVGLCYLSPWFFPLVPSICPQNLRSHCFHDVIVFSRWVILHCVSGPHFLYPFFCKSN